MSRINTNVTSLIAQRVLQTNNNQLNRSLERLSTGLRINSGADDPAGPGRAGTHIIEDLAREVHRQFFPGGQQIHQTLVSRVPGGIDDPADQHPVAALQRQDVRIRQGGRQYYAFRHSSPL